MADVPSLSSGDQEMAAALDEALDALQRGLPVDRAALVARHPALSGLVDQLLKLFAPTDGGVAASPPIARPTQVGPYVVERELGAGGFGVVYLAYDPGVKRRVAVKLLHPGRLGEPEALARFQREACANGRLRHPGIVQLFDYSREGPPWYLVTEYVEGVEPREWCRRGAAGPREIAELVARIADAVEYAHRQGVCHRDLKPGNVLVDGEGRPHVLDFGLARLDPGQQTSLPTQTGHGHVLGSLAYMPPEQASGHSHTADARSDVYSLGVILYELLTGSLPFRGQAHELPALVMEANPAPPRELVAGLSQDLEAVCLKALARRPDDRYAGAAELAADLRAHLDGGPVLARRDGVWGRLRRALARRHLETLRRGWAALLLPLGLTFLVGGAVVNRWELTAPPGWPLLAAVFATKAVQFVLMLCLARWLWPREAGSRRWRWADRTSVERQVLSLVPGYYGAYLILLVLNATREAQTPTAPVLAMMAGTGFLTLGATVYGWFYVYGACFFGLALAVGLAGDYGTTALGVGWFACLAAASVQLQWSR